MRERSYLGVLLVVAALGVAADQASKYGVFGWLAGVPSHCFALFQTEPVSRTFATVPLDEDPLAHTPRRGFFLEVAFEFPTLPGEPLRPHVNQGALFGFLREHKAWANLLFAGISVLAALAIVIWGVQPSTRKDAWLCIALGLILGGTLGNLYDRILFNGVRDFLHWNYLFDWPVFNIADCALVVGACMLVFQATAPQPKEQPQEQAKADEPRKVLNVGSIISDRSAV